MEQEFVERMIESVRDLQAARIAQARMLRALIASHPNPDALREAWHRFSSPSISDASTSRVLNPERQAIHDAMLLAMKDWGDRLAADLPPPSPPRE